MKLIVTGRKLNLTDWIAFIRHIRTETPRRSTPRRSTRVARAMCVYARCAGADKTLTDGAQPMQAFTKTILAGVFAGVTLAGVAGVSGCAQSGTQRSTGQTIDDASVTARVKAALVQAPEVSSTDIDVSTNHGVVQLSGFVDSPAEAQHAVAAAQSVSGVRSVKNDMRVKPRS